MLAEISSLPLDEKIKAINEIKIALHEISPFKSEPVDCVIWVSNVKVRANEWNPNSVAPPEMLLLEHSISSDGYTQPIVSFDEFNDIKSIVNGSTEIEVVDGFHRHRVGKESETICKRVHSYLPVVVINNERGDKSDRMAATIRHNRARGKHAVDSMSDIVIELKRRNWSDEKIGKELGMEPDEVLRLTQVSGLATMFADRDFSEAWEAERFEDIIEAEIIEEIESD